MDYADGSLIKLVSGFFDPLNCCVFFDVLSLSYKTVYSLTYKFEGNGKCECFLVERMNRKEAIIENFELADKFGLQFVTEVDSLLYTFKST